jgi:hypothetical protein
MQMRQDGREMEDGEIKNGEMGAEHLLSLVGVNELGVEKV